MSGCKAAEIPRNKAYAVSLSLTGDESNTANGRFSSTSLEEEES